MYILLGVYETIQPICVGILKLAESGVISFGVFVWNLSGANQYTLCVSHSFAALDSSST